MMNELHLTDLERLEMRNALASVTQQYGNDDFHQFVYHCWRSGSGLPARLSQALFNLRMGRGGASLLIRGLPLAEQTLPPTPASRGATWNQASLFARKMICMTVSQIGHIYNFSSKKDFDYIDDVFPIYADSDAQLGTNRAFLEWHVEDGFHPAKADLAALLCLRGDQAAQTYICEAADLELAPHFRDELVKPNFLITVDPTFQSSQGGAKEFRCAVLSDGQDPEIVYDPAYMRGVTPFAQAALEHVRECIDSVYQSVTLEAGDMLLFDNRRAMHARSSYQPAYDGSDRWLLRALILESYWKARECLSELALTTPVSGWNGHPAAARARDGHASPLKVARVSTESVSANDTAPALPAKGRGEFA